MSNREDRGLRKDGDFGQPPPASHDGAWYEPRIEKVLNYSTIGVGLWLVARYLLDKDHDDDDDPGSGIFDTDTAFFGNRQVVPHISEDMVIATIFASLVVARLALLLRPRHSQSAAAA